MRWLVFILFFVSGACGLMYQVAWTRIMTTVFGTTVFAVSLVLTAFMSGLAIGSYFLGRRADKSRNPLRLYAYYEVGIGVTALISLFLMARLTPLYVWMNSTFGYSFLLFTILRFVAAFVILIVPTVLMGATLPILSRFVIIQLGQVGRHLGSLYSINTFGAVCGSLLAGFVLIGLLGVSNTVYLAVLLNLAVGGVAWLGSRKAGFVEKNLPVEETERVPPTGKSSATQERKRGHTLLLWAFAISGFTSFGYEIFWTRSLVFLLGNSTYAFVTMLTAFLTGIALGGYLIRYIADRVKDPLRLFGWIEIMVGVTAAAAMPLLITFVYSEIIPSLFKSGAQEWGAQIFYRFGAAFLVMLVPTTLLGATFPLVGRAYVKNLARTGSDVGKVYAVNTFGNIIGAFLPSFLILPVLGINKGILFMAALNVTVGGGILLTRWRRASLWHAVPVCLLLCLVIFICLGSLHFQFPSDSQVPGDKVLFYKEGVSATTKVFFNPDSGEKSISVDGVSIGGTSPLVNKKQQILAHLPKLLLDEYRSELSIGLGSGILIGECAKHENLEKIVCVELAPGVVEGATFFKNEHNNVMQDPRVKIVVNDGVNYLLTSEESFDIVSSDAKSKPEYGGNGVFFSREYYTLIREHLTPGGLMIQWIPIHYPLGDYLMILRTFTAVFPHASLWFIPHESSFLLGSLRPLEVDFGKLKNAMSDPSLPLKGIRELGFTSAEALLSFYVASEDSLRKRTEGIEENCFEYPYIAFYSPQEYAVSVNERALKNLELILSLRTDPGRWAWLKNVSKEGRPRLRSAFRAQSAYLRGLRVSYEQRSDSFDEMTRAFQEAIDIAQWNDALRSQVSAHYLNSALFQFNRQKFEGAERLVTRALSVFQESEAAHYIYGSLLRRRGALEPAAKELEKAIELKPVFLAARRELASIFAEQGKFRKAIEQLAAVVAQDPENINALLNLGWYLGEKETEYGEAAKYLERAYKLAPERADVIDAYAWISFQGGDKSTAVEIVQVGGRYYKKNLEYQQRRRLILNTAGE